MKLNLRLGAPEAIGLAVVGATLGAVVFGAAADGITAHSLLGAILGAGGALVAINGRFVLPHLLRNAGYERN